MSDRVLLVDEQRQGWAGFWDWDDPTPVPGPLLQNLAQELERTILEFRSGKGYHYIALNVTDLQGKLDWWKKWTSLSDSLKVPRDYVFARDNVLRLNEKNGSAPLFRRLTKELPNQRASSFHMALLMKSDPSIGHLLHMAFPREVRTWGRTKVYSSDPNGIVDIALEKNLKPVLVANLEPRQGGVI